MMGKAYVPDEQWEPVVKVNPPKGVLTAQNTEPLKVMERYELSGYFLCHSWQEGRKMN